MIKGMKTRGERLKARRLELKLTLKQVAEAVGISLPGVQNLERGDVMPSLEIGLSLAKCLRKPVQWILYGTESDPDRVPVIGTTESGPDRDWQPGEPANTERFLPFVSQRSTVYALTVGNQIQRNYQPETSSWWIPRSRWYRVRMYWFVRRTAKSLFSGWRVLTTSTTTLIVLTLNGLSMIKVIFNLCTK